MAIYVYPIRYIFKETYLFQYLSIYWTNLINFFFVFSSFQVLNNENETVKFTLKHNGVKTR